MFCSIFKHPIASHEPFGLLDDSSSDASLSNKNWKLTDVVQFDSYEATDLLVVQLVLRFQSVLCASSGCNRNVQERVKKVAVEIH